MATSTSARREVDTIGLFEAASHHESAFLAPGRHDRSTIRLEVYFFLATRASRTAGRWATNDRLKSLPPGLVRLPFPLWTTPKHLECPQIRTVHRPSTIDVPQKLKISPGGAQKKPLNLLPRRRHHGVPGRSEPPTGGADPGSGAHLSRIQPAYSHTAQQSDNQENPAKFPPIPFHAHGLHNGLHNIYRETEVAPQARAQPRDRAGSESNPPEDVPRAEPHQSRHLCPQWPEWHLAAAQQPRPARWQQPRPARRW